MSPSSFIGRKSAIFHSDNCGIITSFFGIIDAFSGIRE